MHGEIHSHKINVMNNETIFTNSITHNTSQPFRQRPQERFENQTSGFLLSSTVTNLAALNGDSMSL